MKLLILTLQSRVSFRLHLLVKCSPPVCIFLISYMSPCVLLSSWNMICPYQIYFHHPYVYCLLLSPVSYTLTVLTVLSKLLWFFSSNWHPTCSEQIQHHLFDFQLQSCMTHSSLPHLSISIISQAWLSSHLVSFSLSYQPAVSFYQPLSQLSPLHSCLLSSHIDLKSKTTTVTIVFNIYLIWTTFENSIKCSFRFLIPFINNIRFVF